MERKNGFWFDDKVGFKEMYVFVICFYLEKYIGFIR